MFPEASWGEGMKRPSVFECHKQFKRVVRTWKMMKEVVQDSRTGKNVEKVKNLTHSVRSSIMKAIAVKINLNKGTVKKASTLSQRMDSPP
jgi:hypothetical protein